MVAVSDRFDVGFLIWITDDAGLMLVQLVLVACSGG